MPYTGPHPSPGNKKVKAGLLCFPKLPFILKTPLEERDEEMPGLTTTSPRTRDKVGPGWWGGEAHPGGGGPEKKEVVPIMPWHPTPSGAMGLQGSGCVYWLGSHQQEKAEALAL